jgi:hypothetical protein
MCVIEPFASADEALLDRKRRFKNLPDRTSLQSKPWCGNTFVWTDQFHLAELKTTVIFSRWKPVDSVCGDTR